MDQHDQFSSKVAKISYNLLEIQFYYSSQYSSLEAIVSDLSIAISNSLHIINI